MSDRPLLFSSAFGPFVFVAAVVFGGSTRSGYSHLADPVSALTEAGTGGSGAIAALFVAAALFGALFALALIVRYRVGDAGMVFAGWLLLANAAMAVLLATALPQDPIGAPMTTTGVAHIVLVALSALCLVAAIVISARRLPRLEAGFDRFFAYSMATVAAMAAGGLAVPLVLASGWPLLGLAERITQLAYLQWFVVTPLRLARRSP